MKKKTMNKKILSFLLALIVIVGNVYLAFASVEISPTKEDYRQVFEYEDNNESGRFVIIPEKRKIDNDKKILSKKLVDKPIHLAEDELRKYSTTPIKRLESSANNNIREKEYKAKLKLIGIGLDGEFPWNELLPHGIKIDIKSISEYGTETIFLRGVGMNENAEVNRNIYKIFLKDGAKLDINLHKLENYKKNFTFSRTDFKHSDDLTVSEFTLIVLQVYNNDFNVEWKDKDLSKMDAPNEASDVKCKAIWGDKEFSFNLGLKGDKRILGPKSPNRRMEIPTIEIENAENGIVQVGQDKYKIQVETDAINGTTFTLTKMATVIVPDDPKKEIPEGYVKVEFNSGLEGEFEQKDKGIFFVLKGKTIAEAKTADPSLTIPTVIENGKTKEFIGWTDGVTKDGEENKVFNKKLTDYTEKVDVDVEFTAKYEDKIPTIEDKDKYSVNYPNTDLRKGEYATVIPKVTDKNNLPTNILIGTVFEHNPSTTYPESVAVAIDTNTGKVIINTTENTPKGQFIIPITVTYPDNSVEETRLVINVVDNDISNESKDPIVNNPVEGDYTINGTGVPKAIIYVQLPDGTKITTNVDNDGEWRVDIPEDKIIHKNDKIIVTQIEKGKTPSFVEVNVVDNDIFIIDNIEHGGGIEFNFFNIGSKKISDRFYYVFTIDKNEYKKIFNDSETKYKIDVNPVIQNDRIMLPIRYVAEAIGADVMWNENTRIATFTKNGLIVTIKIDDNKMVLSDGRVVEMDTKPLNINSRILISVVNIGNIFGLTNGNVLDDIDQDIEWNESERTATIYIMR